ncbi:carbonyl reductase [NADPH] 1-like isoform X1 [Alosa sapidissima]|uniref:carbonyl reductase [NADPH] 1-like isoform X1 n=1 Tax=Alosa sapidissima TaxID=34773 RepID=UPI001C098964|nr:carbonyl reductase [NADPH] 1-like isoform X1 [Alosa sapidissima]
MAKQVAVVTGANKGIGLAIVQGLCKAGYAGDIILTARNEKLGQETLQKLKSEGFNNVLFHRLDICDQTSAEGLRKFLDKNYGGLDVLINNAGIAFKVDATEPFGEQAEVTMRTNFWGTLWASKALLPLLRPNARVVNVSSFFSKRALDKCSPELQAKFRSADISEEELCGLMGEFVVAAQNGNHEAKGWPNTAYGATKVGVTVLSRIQARVLAQTRAADGILLNACCPGWVRTDMAGPKAPKSPEEGAETPVYLAMLPPGATAPHGQLVWDKTVQEW